MKNLTILFMISLSLLITACSGSESGDAKVGTIAPAVTPTTTPRPNTSTYPGPTPAPPAKLASRVQGVAPLAVFFDAINVPGVAQPPEVNGRREYADFNYTWNFNDPSSGTWATSGRSKNEASGYVAAHVFETPGTYTVTLSVKDGIGVDETHQVTITVADPDTVYARKSTICVSSTSVFTGCPSGAIQLTTTVATDISTYIAAGRRILFRRGDTWSTNGVIWLSNADNLTIGAYGACTSPDARGICSNAPLFNLSGDSAKGFFHSHNQSDTRIMDLHFVDAGTRDKALGGLTGLDKLLYLRLKSEGFSIPFTFSHYKTGGHDQIALVDNDSSLGRYQIVYVGSERLMVLGNRLRDPDDSHVLRVWQAYKGVIAHNELSGSSANSSSGRHALKLHGPTEDMIQRTDPGGLDRRTQYVVIANNLIGGSGPWPVTMGPTNGSKNEYLQDIVVENNAFYPGWGTQSCCSSGVQVALTAWASYVTIRNNIFSGEGSSKYYRAIHISRRGVEPDPTGNRVFNNTIYKSEDPVGNDRYSGVVVGATAVDSTVKNNLAHFNSNVLLRAVVVDNGTNSTVSNNLLTSTPGLMDPDNPNFMAKDFRLDVNSPAINTGTNVPVFKNKDGSNRTLGVATDLGAYERQ